MSQANQKALNDLIDLVITNFAKRFNLDHIAGTLPELIKARINYDDPAIEMVMMRAHQILHEYEGQK